MNAYTYLIKCKINNTHYYGVRWGNKVSPNDDLWIKYFTSSNIIKELILKYGKKAFDYQVRKEFSNKEDAIMWEIKVLTRLKVLDKPKIWNNRVISKAIRYSIHPRIGVKLSQITKDKISLANLGKKRTSELKKQQSLKRSGKGHWNYGKFTSLITKEKSSLTNKLTWQKKLCNPELLQDHIQKSIHTKNWILVSPEGKQITINNLNEFCRNNNLHSSNLISKGKCKGWILLKT
jgi:hypothetical protein